MHQHWSKLHALLFSLFLWAVAFWAWEGLNPTLVTMILSSNLINQRNGGRNEEWGRWGEHQDLTGKGNEEGLRVNTHCHPSYPFVCLTCLHSSPLSITQTTVYAHFIPRHLPLPPTHILTLSRSGRDHSLISSLDPLPPPPPPFSLQSTPFAELPPYRGICVGVGEGSFCSVQEHLHQWKTICQGLPVCSVRPGIITIADHPLLVLLASLETVDLQ